MALYALAASWSLAGPPKRGPRPGPDTPELYLLYGGCRAQQPNMFPDK